MRPRQRAERHHNQRELPDRRARGDAHQRAIAAPGADQRRDRLDQRDGEREDQRVMSDFDDHGFAFPSCQRPCFFSISTIPGGM